MNTINLSSSSNVFGKRATPSYAPFNENGWRQSATNHSNTIGKRLLGRQWNDDKEQFPFPEIQKNSRPYIQIQGKVGLKILSPEEIFAMLFRILAKTAENYLGKVVKDMVITVPTYFNDAQRQATKNAGRIAGLNVLKILNEPTAAAMAHALNSNEDEKIILVFDLGDGTLDITIMSIKDSVFTVLSTCGNTQLGGEDFDQRINCFIKEPLKQALENVKLKKSEIADVVMVIDYANNRPKPDGMIEMIKTCEEYIFEEKKSYKNYWQLFKVAWR